MRTGRVGRRGAREAFLSLSDIDAVARRIGDAFDVDPGRLHFLRLQASMVFRGEDGWVYRVPAKTHVRDGFADERDLMALLADRMPVATPVWEVAGHPPVARYRYIPGEPLQPRDVANDAAGERVISGVAAFLVALHTTTPPSSHGGPIKGMGMQRWAKRLRRSGRPALADRLERSVADFVAAMVDRPSVLCHGDLKGSNVLIDATTSALVGVIDFSGWTVAPPETDLARIGLADLMLNRLADRYESIGGTALDRSALAAAARFFACRMEAKRALKRGR